MELRAKLRDLRGPAAELRGNGPGFQAPQANPDTRRGASDCLQQIDQRQADMKLPAPAGNLDARHHNFTVALRGQL